MSFVKEDRKIKKEKDNMSNFNETNYLQELMTQKTRVTLFLMNGFQMHGTITGMDRDVIWFYSEGDDQMIYKHAISTVKRG